MEEKIIVFKMLYQKLDTPKKRQQYLEGLGEEWTELQQSGLLYLDQRDHQVYDCVIIFGCWCMTLEFRLNIGRCNQADTGRYTWKGANKACPHDWTIPTQQDFQDLIDTACDLCKIPRDDNWGNNIHTIDFYIDSVIKCLTANKKLGIYLQRDSYYNDEIVKYWMNEQSNIYNHEGQNEWYIGFKAARRATYAYLWPIQPWTAT